jgi:antitoxin component YwqK of YwqJK toxin-antitoxin module
MKKSITPENNKGQRHGLWEYYHNGELVYKCLYNNDKLVGYVEHYWHSGKLTEKTYHI